MAKIKLAQDVFDSFWNKVDTGGENDCWEWTGPRVRNRGQLWWNGKHQYAHRLAWELSKGPIPDDMLVCHHCDNPPCCNPKHLFLGNQKDNMKDASQKGRMWSARGPRVTHCVHGHEYTPENTVINSNGRRECLICKRDRALRWAHGHRKD